VIYFAGSIFQVAAWWVASDRLTHDRSIITSSPIKSSCF